MSITRTSASLAVRGGVERGLAAVFRRRLLLAVAAFLPAACAWAQGNAGSYPSGPITFVVPFTPGGTTDIAARIVARQLAEAWKQPVLVENKAGAGGTIGTAQVIKARPDGLTVLVAPSALGVRAGIDRNMPQDYVQSLAGVGMMARAPVFLIVASSMGVASVSELVQRVKQRDDVIYGSAGVGTGGHMHGALFASQQGLKAVHAPYRGTPEAVTDAVTERVAYAFAPAANVLSFVRDGRGRVLGVTSQAGVDLVRSEVPVPPEVVEDELGDDWFAAFVPAGTPMEIRRKLNQEINRILGTPETRKALENIGAVPVSSTPGELDRMFSDYVALSRKVGERIGIRLD